MIDAESQRGYAEAREGRPLGRRKDGLIRDGEGGGPATKQARRP